MKKHGLLWWLFIGWWWRLMTLPIRLLFVFIRWGRNYVEGADERTQRIQTKQSEIRERLDVKKGVYIQQGQELPRSQEGQETHKVAGVNFKQEAIENLGVRNPDFSKTKQAIQAAGMADEWIYEYNFDPQKVELVPEPDNPHDPKAIKVVVDDVHIGYIKAGSCAHVHKLLAADQILKITCFIGGGKSKGLFKDDDDENYAIEQSEIPFYARLTITTK